MVTHGDDAGAKGRSQRLGSLPASAFSLPRCGPAPHLVAEHQVELTRTDLNPERRSLMARAGGDSEEQGRDCNAITQPRD